MITNTEVIILFVVFFVFVCPVLAESIWINNVDLIPSQPSDSDLITFSISGTASNGGPYVVYDQFLQNGTSLQLDLYIEMGIIPVISPWTYSKQIQPLEKDNYSLEVRTFDYYYPGTIQDTYNIDFSVVPEPSTLSIFAFALPIFRYFLRRKIK
jgi:hypothetical protein